MTDTNNSFANIPQLGRWIGDAACAGKTFEPQTAEERQNARVLCSQCPVKVECLNYAIELSKHGRMHGVWAGADRVDLERMARLPREQAVRDHFEALDRKTRFRPTKVKARPVIWGTG